MIGVLLIVCVVWLPAHTVFAYSNIVAFGDSLSDNGNIERATNGCVWVEYLADDDRLDADLFNFAHAGATTGFSLQRPYGLVTQAIGSWILSYFYPTFTEDALFTVWAGGNDLRGIDDPADAPAVIGSAVTNIATTLTILIEGVGADDILVPNLPDLGLIPENNWNPQLSAMCSAATLAFNTALDDTLDLFAVQYPTVNLYRLDTYAVMYEIIDDGIFENVTDPWLGSGGDPDEYLFYDSIHPTTAAHSILADYAYAAVTEVPEPATLILMGVALLGFAVLRRKL